MIGVVDNNNKWTQEIIRGGAMTHKKPSFLKRSVLNERNVA